LKLKILADSKKAFLIRLIFSYSSVSKSLIPLGKSNFIIIEQLIFFNLDFPVDYNYNALLLHVYMFLDNIEYLDHMTDAYIRCRGKTLAHSFQLSARGLVNIMYDIDKIEKKQKIHLSAEGFDLESLLYSWLEKILLLILIDKIVLTEFRIILYFNKELDKYLVEGYGEGDFVNFEKHEFNVEIKGITYHQMKIFHDPNLDEFVIEYIVDL